MNTDEREQFFAVPINIMRGLPEKARGIVLQTLISTMNPKLVQDLLDEVEAKGLNDKKHNE